MPFVRIPARSFICLRTYLSARPFAGQPIRLSKVAPVSGVNNTRCWARKGLSVCLSARLWASVFRANSLHGAGLWGLLACLSVRLPACPPVSRANSKCWRLSQEVERKFDGLVPRLDPVEDMGINDPALAEAVGRVEAAEERLVANPVYQVPSASKRAWLFSSENEARLFVSEDFLPLP
jgi:rRNA-processing arch domain